jgi:hypothetical protein
MRGLGVATFAGTIGLIVHSLGTISFLTIRIMEPYWFLVALCVVARENAIHSYWAQVRAAREQAALEEASEEGAEAPSGEGALPAPQSA